MNISFGMAACLMLHCMSRPRAFVHSFLYSVNFSTCTDCYFHRESKYTVTLSKGDARSQADVVTDGYNY